MNYVFEIASTVPPWSQPSIEFPNNVDTLSEIDLFIFPQTVHEKFNAHIIAAYLWCLCSYYYCDEKSPTPTGSEDKSYLDNELGSCSNRLYPYRHVGRQFFSWKRFYSLTMRHFGSPSHSLQIKTENWCLRAKVVHNCVTQEEKQCPSRRANLLNLHFVYIPHEIIHFESRQMQCRHKSLRKAICLGGFC